MWLLHSKRNYADKYTEASYTLEMVGLHQLLLWIATHHVTQKIFGQGSPLAAVNIAWNLLRCVRRRVCRINDQLLDFHFMEWPPEGCGCHIQMGYPFPWNKRDDESQRGRDQPKIQPYLKETAPADRTRRNCKWQLILVVCSGPVSLSHCFRI